MRKLLALAAALEAATGLGLLILPSLVIRALLGADVDGTGLALGRAAGCAMLSLGIACWLGPNRADVKSLIQPVRAMFTYNLLIAICLVYFRVGVGISGPLLWPVAVTHFVLALLFVRVLFGGLTRT